VVQIEINYWYVYFYRNQRTLPFIGNPFEIIVIPRAFCTSVRPFRSDQNLNSAWCTAGFTFIVGGIILWFLRRK